MSLREHLNSNPVIATSVTVGALVLAVLVLLWQLGEPAAGEGEYYYDPQTEALFIAPFDSHAPVSTPSGGDDGLRARVFGCGQCPGNLEGMTLEEVEAAGATIGWLERYSEQARQILEQYDELPDDEEELERVEQAEEEGAEVRPVGADTWYPVDSPAGDALFDRIAQRCAGAVPMECYP